MHEVAGTSSRQQKRFNAPSCRRPHPVVSFILSVIFHISPRACTLAFAQQRTFEDFHFRNKSWRGEGARSPAMGNELSARVPSVVKPVDAYINDLSEHTFVQR